MSKQNSEKILYYAEQLGDKFYIVPMKKNEDGKFKVPIINKDEPKTNFDYKNFKQKIENFKDNFGLGVYLGEQKLTDENGQKLYLYCLDFDADVDEDGKKIDFVSFIKDLLSTISDAPIEELLEGYEKTCSGRAHYLFMTTTPYSGKKKKVNHWYKIKKDGGRVEGEIELRGEKQALALHEGIICDLEKVPVLARNIPIFSKEEVDALLSKLGFVAGARSEQTVKNIIKIAKKQIVERQKSLDSDRNVIDEIKRKMRIEDIAEEFSDCFSIVYDHGDRLDCLCPFNPEKNPSFSIYEQEDGTQIAVLFHDCGIDISNLPYVKNSETGYFVFDVIDIYMLLTGKTFKEAIKELADRAGIQVPYTIPIYRSPDSKHFYLIDEKRKSIYVDNIDRAKIWFKDFTYKYNLQTKFSEFLPTIEKVELRFTPTEPFGFCKVNGESIINAFYKTQYMELYNITEKTLTLNDINIGCFKEMLTQRYLLNLLDNEENLRALSAFLVLKLAGKKAQKMLILRTNQGTGKSNILVPILRELFSDECVKVIPYDKLTKKFNPEFENAYLIVVEEMYLRDKGSDSEKYEYLKILTTSDKIQINKKGINEYFYDFPADFIGFSNNETPILISDLNDRRIIVLESNNSVDFYKIYQEEFGLKYEQAFEIIKNDFLDFVADILFKIDVEEAIKYLNELVHEQNKTVKYEMKKKHDKLLILIDEHEHIEDYLVKNPNNFDEWKCIDHVKSGIATTQDIAVVLRLMGDDYYSKNANVVGRKLTELGIKEVKSKRRYKILKKDLNLSLKDCENIYNRIEKGIFGCKSNGFYTSSTNINDCVDIAEGF